MVERERQTLSSEAGRNVKLAGWLWAEEVAPAQVEDVLPP